MSFKVEVFPRRWHLLLLSPPIIAVAVATGVIGALLGRWLLDRPVMVAVSIFVLALATVSLHGSVLYGMEQVLDGTENARIMSVAVPASAYLVILFTFTMYLLPGFVVGGLHATGRNLTLALAAAPVVLYSLWIIPFGVL